MFLFFFFVCFFFQAEDGILDVAVTGVQTCALPISMNRFYQGDWIDSMASRFIEELPEKFLEKNSFFDEIGRASCRERV